MTSRTADIERIHQKVEVELGTEANAWTQWPGGWRDDIAASLIDAVYSARARYSGIQPLVATWTKGQSGKSSLPSLIKEIDAKGPQQWAKDFGNSQTSPGRSKTAPGGPTKAAAIREAAALLSDIGVNHAKDITPETAKDVKATLQRVQGIGYATSNYFLMLLGAPGVKPDRMIHRFLESDGRQFTNAQAEEIITAVAERLHVAPHVLDHAIWAYESQRVVRG
jgi:hypothetical protein